MTVYVDECKLAFRGKQWCHLVADTLDELHAFADELGLKRDWFQHKTLYPHYDITLGVRSKAVELGAQTCDKRTVVQRAKGLRLQLNALHRERFSAMATEEGSSDQGFKQPEAYAS